MFEARTGACDAVHFGDRFDVVRKDFGLGRQHQIESVLGVELLDGRLTVRTSQLGAFARAVPSVARAEGITVRELRPTDESLEDVFTYLVNR